MKKSDVEFLIAAGELAAGLSAGAALTTVANTFLKAMNINRFGRLSVDAAVFLGGAGWAISIYDKTVQGTVHLVDQVKEGISNVAAAMNTDNVTWYSDGEEIKDSEDNK